MDATVNARATSLSMRGLLMTAAVLVFIAGFQLYVFTERTDFFFAWTIAPPNNVFLTAAFLGAAYWASGILEAAGARQGKWSNARIAVPSVLLFTTLTLIVTLIHLSKFHLGAPFGQPAAPFTIFMTYVWIVIYVAVPVLMAVLLVMQLRARGDDLPRTAPLPRWVRVLMLLQAAIMLAAGVSLLFAPQTAPAVWPWKLTALTAQAIGAWMVSLPVAALQAVWENDLGRAKAGWFSYAAFGALQLIALARYPADLNWADPRAWVYLALILSILLVGLAGWWKTR